jgi:molybdate transport system ATP-binding protein
VLDVEIALARRGVTVEVALQVRPGERLALFGPSGAGKTSVLEVIAGLLRPDRGRVALGGRELTRRGLGRDLAVPPWSRRVGLLRQDPGLFPHLDVRANIAYSRAAARGAEPLALMAERLEIVALLGERPRALSGGQAHRVALARLLVACDDALLLDEPYTGLDHRLRRVLTEVVREEAARRQVPSVLVAHELAEAQAFADRIAVIDQGRILQEGSPVEVVRRPGSRRVAELVGYLGFIPAAALASAGGPRHDDRQGRVLGVHPDRCRPGTFPAEGVTVPGRVLAARPNGAAWEVDLAVGAPTPRQATVTCRTTEEPPAPGSSFELTVLDPPWFEGDGSLAVRASGVPV